MKLPLICSFLLHAGLGVVMFITLPKRHFKAVHQDIREVQLVSLPKPVVEKPAEVPKAPPKPKPEPVIQKTEKKKEPVKKEVEKPVEKKVEKPAVVSEPDTAEVEAEAVPAAGTSDVKVEIDDFPFAYYLSLIQYRIKESWRPPMQTPGDNASLTVFVAFRISRNGRIDQVNLEQSSGRFLFDQAARRAITTMRKLPPLPADFSGENLMVHIEFESEY